jgi:hypothetical protein
MISATVDHRAAFGAARHQGQRLTCLAFAMSDLNRQVSPAPDVLSPEYLYQHAGATTPGWKAGGPLPLAPALNVVGQHGQPLEAAFPYLGASPATVAVPVAPAGGTMYRSGLREIQKTSDVIVAELEKGHVVGLIINTTQTMASPVDGVVAFSPMIVPNNAHAVVAVGLGETADGKPHVLIRNSWGVTWGLDGHAWLPMEYIDLHVLQAFGR